MINHAQMEGIQMSRRLNYGIRFGQSSVSAHHTVLDDTGSYANRMARADRAKMRAIMENTPLHARELQRYKAATTNKRKSRAKSQPIKDERLEAERRMLEALRKVVSTLEFHLEELHRTRKVGNEKGLVNQYGIHNALVALRTKCGVRFEPNEYDHTLHIAEVLRSAPRTEEQIHDETVSEREQQRLSRLRNMKAQAERFITKYRGTT
jgi:hypothetical protein